MLIGVPPLLGPELLFTLRSMGHGDEIALVDGNYPAQEHARRLVRADGLGILALAEAILTVMPVDRDVPPGIWRAAPHNRPGEMSPFHAAVDAMAARIARVAPEPLDGAALYPRIRAAHTVVATTEPALFANVILRKGVIAQMS
jgi:L-fucose mutarotase